MSEDNTRDDNTSHVKSARINHPYNQAHENEPIDKYREYLAHKDEPVDKSRNSRNLFHELNSTDTYWFNIARANLAKSS